MTGNTNATQQIIQELSHQPQPRWDVSSVQQQQIEAELNCTASKDGMMRVMMRIQYQDSPHLGEIDWEGELATFEPFTYPAYYLQPFHSVLGGYLSETAAVSNRVAMEAILENAHPQKSLGVRAQIAQLFPPQAQHIVDLGAGIGDDAATIARQLPQATVTAIELSPYMIIVGRRLHQNISNLQWKHGLAEQTELPNNSVDAVNLTYLLHECPDSVKKTILAEAFRILKPEGMIIVSDALPGDLHSHRGFFEPYKEQWLNVNPDRLLTDAGFVNIQPYPIAYPIWTRIASKRLSAS